MKKVTEQVASTQQKHWNKKALFILFPTAMRMRCLR